MIERIYSSDLSDGKYKFLKKCLPKQKSIGKPPGHALREMFKATFYSGSQRLCAAIFTK